MVGIQTRGCLNFLHTLTRLQWKTPTESHYERFQGSQAEDSIQKGITNLDNSGPVRKNKTICGKSGENWFTRPTYAKHSGLHPALIRMAGIWGTTTFPDELVSILLRMNDPALNRYYNNCPGLLGSATEKQWNRLRFHAKSDRSDGRYDCLDHWEHPRGIMSRQRLSAGDLTQIPQSSEKNHILNWFPMCTGFYLVPFQDWV